jgi:hypothetical protein
MATGEGVKQKLQWEAELQWRVWLQIQHSVSIIRTNWDRGSSLNQIFRIIKHAWEYYHKIL